MEFIVNPDRLMSLERDYSPVVDNWLMKHATSKDLSAGGKTQDHPTASSVYFLPPRPTQTNSLLQESDLKRVMTQRCIQVRGTVEQEYEEKITSFTKRDLESQMRQSTSPLPPRNVHPALAFAILKDRFAKRVVDVKTLFPAECFQFQGRILYHHLRNALNVAGISISDSDFRKLWNRFDRHNTGMIQTRQFFKDVDLDMLGRPLHLTGVPSVTASAVVSMDMQRPKTAKKNDLKTHEHFIKQRKDSTCVCKTTDASIDKYVISTGIIMKPSKDGHVTEALLKGFRLYDSDDDGLISIKNFLHVLEEFAVVLPQSIMKLLSSLSWKGQWIHYKEYLSHFNIQTAIRTGNGRWLMTNRKSKFGSDQIDEREDILLAELCSPNDSLPSLLKNNKVEEKKALRTVMLKIKEQVRQQRAYLKTYFQARDRMGLGHIAVGEMKSIMNRMYWSLAENEKKLLCETFDLHGNGRFHYAVFLENI